MSIAEAVVIVGILLATVACYFIWFLTWALTLVLEFFSNLKITRRTGPTS